MGRIQGYKEKFFVYSPSGGLSNQRMEFEYALHIGKILNRSVLLPMLAPHTSLWHNYAKVPRADLCPVDHIFDTNFMETYGTKVYMLNISIAKLEIIMRKLPQTLACTLYYRERQRRWHEAEVAKILGPVRSKILFLKGPTMFHQWFPLNIVQEVRVRSRYTSEIRNLAMSIIHFTFPDTYYAVHIRLGDKVHLGFFPDTEEWAEKMIASNFSTDVPLYIATEPKDVLRYRGVYKPFLDKWKVIFANDLGPKAAITEFKRKFPRRMRNDMFGVVEQLICANAQGFKGSPYSRFSRFISFMRKNRQTLFPESIRPNKEIAFS